jgi:hypothetical protein
MTVHNCPSNPCPLCNPLKVAENAVNEAHMRAAFASPPLTNEATYAWLIERYHIEGQSSTEGPRWLIWDGVEHYARFRDIASADSAHAICAELNTRPANPVAGGLVERLRSSAKAFRENTVYDSEGDPLRLIVQADEFDEAADALEALSREQNAWATERQQLLDALAQARSEHE